MTTLSMPVSRSLIRKQVTVAAQLQQELRAKGVVLRQQRRKSKRDLLIEAAATGRAADLPQAAREAISQRRAQRERAMVAHTNASMRQALDVIAGRV